MGWLERLMGMMILRLLRTLKMMRLVRCRGGIVRDVL